MPFVPLRATFMQKLLEPRPAHPEEWAQAFGLIFQHLPKEDRQERVRNALRLMQQGELDPLSQIPIVPTREESAFLQ